MLVIRAVSLGVDGSSRLAWSVQDFVCNYNKDCSHT